MKIAETSFQRNSVYFSFLKEKVKACYVIGSKLVKQPILIHRKPNARINMDSIDVRVKTSQT